MKKNILVTHCKSKDSLNSFVNSLEKLIFNNLSPLHHLTSIKQHHLASIKQHQLASIKQLWRKPLTCRKSQTNFITFLLYTSPWAGFEPTSVVIGTDYIGSYISNYHTISATTAPSSFRPFNLLNMGTMSRDTLSNITIYMIYNE